MNDDELHYATCPIWATGSWADCDCRGEPVWRIRKEPDEVFAWRIWRRDNDGRYEHLMRCSTWAGALALVEQFMWLRKNALTGDLQ